MAAPNRGGLVVLAPQTIVQSSGSSGTTGLFTPKTIGSFTVPSGYNAAFIDNVTFTGLVNVASGSTLVILNGSVP